jgi:hypothetical protein
LDADELMDDRYKASKKFSPRFPGSPDGLLLLQAMEKKYSALSTQDYRVRAAYIHIVNSNHQTIVPWGPANLFGSIVLNVCPCGRSARSGLSRSTESIPEGKYVTVVLAAHPIVVSRFPARFV